MQEVEVGFKIRQSQKEAESLLKKGGYSLLFNTETHDVYFTNKRITKKIRRLDDDNIILTIEDIGVGIKDSMNVHHNIGCEIIKSLTGQLGGNISATEKKDGTEYKVVFPIEMEHTIHWPIFKYFKFQK